MGFSVWVADDPELEVEGSDVSSDFPHFSLSRAGMAALRTEMQIQGMFDHVVSTRFVLNGGEHVPVQEIASALEVAMDEPITAEDEELRELWTSWLAFLRVALGHGGIRVY
jgi:hypothetical protein